MAGNADFVNLPAVDVGRACCSEHPVVPIYLRGDRWAHTLTADEAIALAERLTDAAAQVDHQRCPTACSEGHTYRPPCALSNMSEP